MRKVFRNLMLTATVLTAIVGCTGNSPGRANADEANRAPQPTDTLYTQQAAMMVYDYDPIRALQVIDSAVIVGNLSPWWADKCRMRIYSQTRAGDRLDSLMQWPLGTRLDSARAIGERLLRHDSIRSSLEGQQDVLEMLAYTARRQNDSTAWLQHSRQLVDVCRQQGAETEALRNEAEVGAALCLMGRQREGMAMLDSVITALSVDEDMKFNELDALVIALKRKIGVMTAHGQSVEVLPLARRIVTLMDDYEQRPDAYHDDSYREPPAEKRDDYIRFYRTQAENYIASAYAVLGNTKDMKTTFERLENIVREAETHEHQARYRALEQQMQRQQAEARAERQQERANHIRLQAIGLFIIALLAVTLAVVLYRSNKAIRLKKRVLAQQLLELYDNTRPATAEDNAEPRGLDALSPEELFLHIRDEVTRLQLYTDPGFSRQSIIERYHLTKDRASSVFSQGSEHAKITDFLNECRLDHARRLLVSRPDMSIADIATASGFGLRNTFSRCFKAKHGISPTEFREQNEQA